MSSRLVDDFVLEEFLQGLMGVEGTQEGSAAPAHQAGRLATYNHEGATPSGLASTAVAVGPTVVPRGEFGQEKMKTEPPAVNTVGFVDDSKDEDDEEEEGAGGVDDGSTKEVKRKRQREANLQAQRRCRERHRAHVTGLEQDATALRNELSSLKQDNARLQRSLQESLLGLEKCRQQSANSDENNKFLQAQLEDCAARISDCTSQSRTLSEKLKQREDLEALGVGQAASGSSPQAAALPPTQTGSGCTPCDQAAAAARAASLAALNNSASRSQGDGAMAVRENALPPLHHHANEAMVNARRELMSTGFLQPVTRTAMKIVVQRVLQSFRDYLIDGNACSLAHAFSGDRATVDALRRQGVPRLAAETAAQLEIRSPVRQKLKEMWHSHAQHLNALFMQRKKLTADALMLQASSPAANLIDFMAIGSGTLSMMGEDGPHDSSQTATISAFARHACRVEVVLTALRQNLNFEQVANFEFVSDVLNSILTPMQVCVICVQWGWECPDLLAISQAIVVTDDSDSNNSAGVIRQSR